MTTSNRSTVTDLRWVPLGAHVVIVGHELDGIYVGESDEASAVERALPVDRSDPDWGATTVTRPPRYRDLTDRARAAYLTWLRTGRRAPQAPADWALLFLYGLERRILHDGDDDAGLVTEARELGAVYGDDPEVRRIVRALAGTPRDIPLPELHDGDVPDDLQVELGRRSLASTPVDAGWARAWSWYHPDIPRGAAATRAPDEFARVWTERFDERYPDGLLVPPRRRRLEMVYTPGNPSLPTPVELTAADASDVFVTPQALRELREVASDVETELEPYVRWLGRHVDRPSGAFAAALLPPTAVEGSPAADAATLVAEYADHALGTDAAVVVDATALLDRWTEVGGASDREGVLALGRVLGRAGVGIEPDVRFGRPRASPGDPVVLFRFDPPPIATPSPEYAAAVVTLDLCAVVAASDGSIAGAEQAALVDQVERVEGLEDAERARLAAHRLFLTTQTVALADATARLGAVDVDGRRRLGEYLIEVAKIDGVVTDAERRTVVGIFRLLGLDPDDAESRLGGADLAEPARRAEPPEPTEVVDTTGPTEVTTERVVDLDEHRLRATQQANRDVQDLLGAIFADEDDEPLGPPPPAPAGSGVIDGLDAAHAAFLKDVVDLAATSRAELEGIARRHGVLPDGAVEVVNEVALDRCDDPVIEVHDDESVSVDHDVYEEMAA